MTRSAIMRDTLDYYSADPSRRATLGDTAGYCSLLMGDGRKCAVGRYCNNLDRLPAEVLVMPYHMAAPMLEMREDQPARFWTDLQSFHDNKAFWDDNGLTAQGQLRFAIIWDEWNDTEESSPLGDGRCDQSTGDVCESTGVLIPGV